VQMVTSEKSLMMSSITSFDFIFDKNMTTIVGHHHYYTFSNI